MKAIEILEACRAAPDEIRAIEQRRQEYLETAEVMGRPPDPTGVSSGRRSDKIGSFATLAADQAAALKLRQARQREELKVARILLDHLPSEQGNVLHLYYIRGYTLSVIAKRKRYSYSYVRRIKKAAEDALALMDEADVDGMLPEWYISNKAP